MAWITTPRGELGRRFVGPYLPGQVVIWEGEAMGEHEGAASEPSPLRQTQDMIAESLGCAIGALGKLLGWARNADAIIEKQGKQIETLFEHNHELRQRIFELEQASKKERD